MKKGHHEPRATASCAACKLLKRRCSPTCIFAPYFRADEPKKFAKVHKVFGASNVSKILNEVPEEHREDTVNSLSYEAEARIQDPVYGCIGAIVVLQRRMFQLQHDLALARARLAQYKARDFHHGNNSDEGGLYNVNHTNNIVHMGFWREESLMSSSSYQLSQCDINCGGYNSSNDNYNSNINEFGQVHDLLPL